jgi:acetyl-CoA acetyltransferase
MSGGVAVVGRGMSNFGAWTGDGMTRVREVVDEALEDAGLAPEDVDEAWWASLAFGGGQLGNPAALVNGIEGLEGVAAHRVENACASGGYAVRSALQAIEAGRCQVALVVGFERMNDQPGHRRGYWLGVSGETPWERMAGTTFPGVYALMASRHAHEHGTTREQLGQVAVKNHRFAADNPKAQFSKEVSLERVVDSPTVADPLRLFDCCGTTDGAAALVLVDAEVVDDLDAEATTIAGAGAASDHLALHERPSLTELAATRQAGRQALAEADAGIEAVDVAEVHDCFTIAEILAVEDLGLVAKGEGGPATEQGRTDRGGECVVNPSGGLKGKGHPLGATGVAQVAEIHDQLLARAGDRQIDGAERGLTHNVGGSGATCAVHVLERGGA